MLVRALVIPEAVLVRRYETVESPEGKRRSEAAKATDSSVSIRALRSKP